MNYNKYNVNKFKHLKLNVSVICIVNKSWTKYLNGYFGQDQFQGTFWCRPNGSMDILDRSKYQRYFGEVKCLII